MCVRVTLCMCVQARTRGGGGLRGSDDPPPRPRPPPYIYRVPPAHRFHKYKHRLLYFRMQKLTPYSIKFIKENENIYQGLTVRVSEQRSDGSSGIRGFTPPPPGFVGLPVWKFLRICLFEDPEPPLLKVHNVFPKVTFAPWLHPVKIWLHIVSGQ